MTTEQRKQLIENLLTEQLQPEILNVIDESSDHIGHQGASTGAGHYAVEIKADCLMNLSKIKQHQKIYSAIGHLIPAEIHALRIVIL